MTMQQLQYLICTAQLGSISQAAESMFVSQSSISKSIRLLEKELGFAILNRSYSGVSFTVQGLNFLRDAYRLVGGIRDGAHLLYTGGAGDFENRFLCDFFPALSLRAACHFQSVGTVP